MKDDLEKEQTRRAGDVAIDSTDERCRSGSEEKDIVNRSELILTMKWGASIFMQCVVCNGALALGACLCFFLQSIRLIGLLCNVVFYPGFDSWLI